MTVTSRSALSAIFAAMTLAGAFQATPCDAGQDASEATGLIGRDSVQFTSQQFIEKFLLILCAEGKPGFIEDVANLFDVKFDKRLMNPRDKYETYISPERAKFTVSVYGADGVGKYPAFNFHWNYVVDFPSGRVNSPPICVDIKQLDGNLIGIGWRLLGRTTGGFKDGISAGVVRTRYEYVGQPPSSGVELHVIVTSALGQENCLEQMYLFGVERRAR